MLSNVQVARIVKAQGAQSPSHPKSKLPKLPKVQVVNKTKMLNTYGSLKAEYINGPTVAKNIYDPPMHWTKVLLGPITLKYWKLLILFHVTFYFS